MSRRGFTLLELLIVVAVIAVLISLLVVGMRDAKRAVEGLRCQNSQRQLVVGLNLMRSSRDGRLPLIGEPHATPVKLRQQWATLVGEWSESTGASPPRRREGVVDRNGYEVWDVEPPLRCVEDLPGAMGDWQVDPAYSVAAVNLMSSWYMPASYASQYVKAGTTTREAAERVVTRAYEQPDAGPVLAELWPLHPGGPKQWRVTLSYLDGSSRRVIDNGDIWWSAFGKSLRATLAGGAKP